MRELSAIQLGCSSMLPIRLQKNNCLNIFVLSLAVFLAVSSTSAFAVPQRISNDKELKIALKNMKTADDHRRVAAYYEEKAQKLQAKAKEEQEMADYFATHPSMYGKLYPTPYQNHKWRAENFQRESSESLQKAREQRMAAESMVTQ